MNYNNQYCAIAAKMLSTEPGLLDYRLVEHLNKIATLVKNADGELWSRQIVALAIVQWQEDKADDFTKKKP